MPMTAKPFRVVTCYEELSPINMNDTSMEWPREVTKFTFEKQQNNQIYFFRYIYKKEW